MKYLSAIMTAVSGSMGNVTGSMNHGAMVLRNKTVPFNPRTAGQVSVREFFGSTAAAWRDLTAANRTAWNSLAASKTFPGKLGQPVTLSGEGLYMKVNAQRAVFGLAPLAEPTANTATACALVYADGVSIDDDVGLTIDFTDADNATWNAAGGAVRVQISGPIPAGQKGGKGPWLKSVVLEGPLAAPETIALATEAVAGQRYAVRIDAQGPDGELAQSSTFILTAVHVAP